MTEVIDGGIGDPQSPRWLPSDSYKASMLAPDLHKHETDVRLSLHTLLRPLVGTRCSPILAGDGKPLGPPGLVHLSCRRDVHCISRVFQELGTWWVVWFRDKVPSCVGDWTPVHCSEVGGALGK
jgi:hypothetical protein